MKQKHADALVLQVIFIPGIHLAHPSFFFSFLSLYGVMIFSNITSSSLLHCLSNSFPLVLSQHVAGEHAGSSSGAVLKGQRGGPTRVGKGEGRDAEKEGGGEGGVQE